MAQLTGYAGVFPGGTSNTYTTPHPIKPGTKAQDVAGNEYVFCDFSGPVSKGEWVVISDVNVASAMILASRGRVGIVVGTGPTSNDAGWVQIYGLNIIAQTSAVSDTVSDAALALRTTSVATTPLGTAAVIINATDNANQIHGAWITTLFPSEAGVAGASDTSWPTLYVTQSSSPAGYQHTGKTLGVFLNYPYVDGNQVDRLLVGNGVS